MAHRSCNSRAVQLVNYFPCKLFSHRVQSYQLDSLDHVFDEGTSYLSNGVYKHLVSYTPCQFSHATLWWLCHNSFLAWSSSSSSFFVSNFFFVWGWTKKKEIRNWCSVHVRRKKDGREFTLGRESLATAPFWGFDIFEWLMRRRISSSSFLVSRFLFIFIDSLMIAFCVWQSNDAAISVAALRSSDGAILDPDDRLADVVDDREQLAACLSNGGSGSELDEASLGVPLVLGPRIGLMNLRGDGTSASSNSGSPSPTDFGLHHQHYGGSHHPSSRKDIEVTGQEAATGLMVDHLHLQVRRGSEPALNRISPDGPTITNGPASAAGQHHQADVPPTSNTRDYKVMCKHMTILGCIFYSRPMWPEKANRWLAKKPLARFV